MAIVADRCVYQTGNLIDGRYTVDKELGEGTFGVVYRVRDVDGKIYALKLLKLWTVPPEVCSGLTDRFRMEYETGKIPSRYLTHTYANGMVGGNPYFVMEYCPNGDLRSYARGGAINYSSVATQILYGLRDLHSSGKIHRDLKPENVLLRSDHTAVLTDFGISGDQNKRMTERGWIGKPKQIFGTYPYMPPEQVCPPRGGRATVLPTTDIFSFGVMMYEMLVGTLPFGELSEATLPRYLENGRKGLWNRAALHAVPNSGMWQKTIEGCLVPDFHNRFQSVDDVLSTLPYCAQMDAPSFAADYVSDLRNGVQLRVMQGEDYNAVYRLNDLAAGGIRIIPLGRMANGVNNRIALRDSECFVSRRHCTLELAEDGTWYVRDGQWTADGWQRSMNGTFCDSHDVDEFGYPLQAGSIITIGDIKLRVEGCSSR